MFLVQIPIILLLLHLVLGTKTSADTSLPISSLTHKLATGSVINFTTTTTGSITLTANADYGATTLTGTITGTITLGTSSNYTN